MRTKKKLLWTCFEVSFFTKAQICFIKKKITINAKDDHFSRKSVNDNNSLEITPNGKLYLTKRCWSISDTVGLCSDSKDSIRRTRSVSRFEYVCGILGAFPCKTFMAKESKSRALNACLRVIISKVQQPRAQTSDSFP